MLNTETMRAVGKLLARTAREAASTAEANDVIDLAPLLRKWEEGPWAVGDVCTWEGLPVWCMTAHDSTGQPMWSPAYETALWAQYHGRDAAHALSFKAEGHNPYNTGHWCLEDGKAYRANRDGVVYPPSVLPEAWEVEDDA